MVRFNKELSITRSSPMKVFHEDELHTAKKKTGINRDSNNSFVRRKANLLIMK